jgi:hypothetical protein
METTPDWLSDEGETQSKLQASTALEALKIAQNYVVFETHPLAKALLAQWQKFVRERKLAPNASHAEYAAANAIREFVELIPKQIEFAHNRGNQPQ